MSFRDEAAGDEFSHVAKLAVVALGVDHLRECDTRQHVLNVAMVGIDAGLEEKLLAFLADQLEVLSIAYDPRVVDFDQRCGLDLLFAVGVEVLSRRRSRRHR